jgi:hypothetical protein
MFAVSPIGALLIIRSLDAGLFIPSLMSIVRGGFSLHLHAITGETSIKGGNFLIRFAIRFATHN